MGLIKRLMSEKTLSQIVLIYASTLRILMKIPQSVSLFFIPFDAKTPKTAMNRME